MVSPLCYGTIPLSPHRGMEPAKAAYLLRRAMAAGVNFIDTAEIYGNYEAIRLALRASPEPVVVATKSYAASAAAMRASLDRARRELDRDRIDLFLLHEMESAATIRGHRAALDFLIEARARGIVRAIGVSTHTVAGVRAACALPELDVLHPLINRAGLGIKDGGPAEMAAAIETAAQLGMGVYAMKALGGGHLGREAAASIAYVRDLPGVAAIAIGIGSLEELLVDLALVHCLPPPEEALAALGSRARRLFVEPWCTGCGACLESCPFGALHLEGGRIRVRAEDCLLCGYCAAVCANLCLKVV